MKRQYTYRPVSDNEEYFWVVEELATEQRIESFFFEEDAQKYMEFLENGGAFAGFTPSFVLIRLNIKENLNEAFSATFAEA